MLCHNRRLRCKLRRNLCICLTHRASRIPTARFVPPKALISEPQVAISGTDEATR